MEKKEVKGLLSKSLLRSSSDVRKSRGVNVLTYVDTKFSAILQNYFMEIKELEMAQAELLDISPSNITSTKFDVNSEELVNKICEHTLEEMRLNMTYEALKEKYSLIIGKEFKPLTTELDDEDEYDEKQI